jgi:tRNA(adenine34) deaminase
LTESDQSSKSNDILGDSATALHSSSNDVDAHQKWMRRALELAAKAAEAGEIPIGAVIVCEGQVVAESGNLKESNQDPLGHAEIIAIRAAAEKLGRWRLSGCTLYVTLEPCTMCSGAIVHARLDRVVYGATDPKAGAVRSLYQILADARLNHTPEVIAGVLEAECSEQLKAFFRRLREGRR